MRLPLPLLLASFAVVSLSSAACSLELGDDTEGDEGAMHFSYGGDGCFFGCGLDRSALQGSMVTVSSKGGDPDVRATARIVGETMARISSQRESCWCSSRSTNESESRSIEPTATCASSETKECNLSLEVETSQPGDPKLEVVDPSGGLIDRVTLHIRPAARIEADVNEGGTKNGDVYEVKRGFKVKVQSRVYDADDDEMIFVRHGVSFDYGDKAILKPDGEVLFGATDVEDMIATGTGETSVRVFAPGAEKVVRFRVVP